MGELKSVVSATHIKIVIAKNCNRYRADTHSVSVQFCGNLPLCYTFADTKYLQPTAKFNSGRSSRRGIERDCNPHSLGCPSSG